jgi:imidazolonepropionase
MKGFAAKRIVTCDAARPGPLGVVEDGAVVLDGERIAYVGPRAGAPDGAALVDLGERLVTPGLVDAHTHACWVGSRHAEYAVRMAGGDYRDIAKAGGGILSTHRAVAAASEDELVDALAARLQRMASLGVTTVEVKSGYGLEPEHERKQLAAIARAGAARAGLPSVVPTFLALHALPESARTDRAAYVARVAGELLPDIARARLASFVDAYVDANAFTVEEARAVGEAARGHGLGVRLHVGQFADVGGAELAASLGAASVDHLEHVSPAGIEVLARAGVAAVLLPVASFTLGQSPPPVQALRAGGVPLVVASDANPGTAPTESLPLALALAVRAYALTPDEALLAATRNAAASLALSDRGVLREGLRADLVAWDLPHEQALMQPWGVAKTHAVLVGGRPR